MYNTNLHFHFIGIGGSGMSGIAEILLHTGFAVSGSDAKLSPVTDRLEKHGAKIFEGHHPDNIPSKASLVVYSSAVGDSNPEMLEATRRNLPIVRRAEVLAELMRLKFGIGVAGSHGKTSTTSMTATILEYAELDPTVVIGGQVKSHGSGGKLGDGDFLVAETDESDKSFLLLKPSIAVVTNIDAEHLSAYESFSELENSFEKFVNSVPFYGLAVLCLDDARVRDLANRYRGRKVTYGLSVDANIRAQNIKYYKDKTTYEVLKNGENLMQVELPMLGQHMVVNSLAAIAIGLELNIEPNKIVKALSGFSGVKRRLEVIGETSGITVMSDYGHHPAEIKATLNAVRLGFNKAMRKFHVVFQPHRYTRTRDCFVEFMSAFSDCDSLYVTEIYAASEDPIEGIDGKTLTEAIHASTKTFVPDLSSIIPMLNEQLYEGDLVLFLGAGSVGTLPEQLIKTLEFRNAA
jgi:UDP-N-acetylmuramate--alanine ligase